MFVKKAKLVLDIGEKQFVVTLYFVFSYHFISHVSAIDSKHEKPDKKPANSYIVYFTYSFFPLYIDMK